MALCKIWRNVWPDIEYNQHSTEQQLEVLHNNLEEQTIELQEFEQNNHHDGLQAALAVRGARAALAQLAPLLDALTHDLRQLDEARISAERELIRSEAITQLQLSEQAARLNQEQFAEQLREAEVDIEQTREQLRYYARRRRAPSVLQAEITRLEQSNQCLGRGQLGGAGRVKEVAQSARIPHRAIGGFDERDDHAGRCDQEN